MLTTPDIMVNAVSMAATITSTAQQTTNMFGCYVSAVYTGSPVGTLKLQASLDGTTWDDIDGSSVSITAAGDTAYNVSEVQYPKIRVVYTRTSGTGTLTVKFFGKGM